jgi:hypothetical protein
LNLAKRWKNRYGGRSTRQVIKLSGKKGLILIIAPGEMPLPSTGWGAVEIIVMKHAESFNELGYEVHILNSWYLTDWLKSWVIARLQSKYDTKVILHYDLFAKRTLFFKKLFKFPTFAVSHFGYASQPHRWNPNFKKSFSYLTKFEGVICLNNSINEVFTKLSLGSAKFFTVSNGCDDTCINTFYRKKKYICVGKVEERKRQYEIASMSRFAREIDFYGPISDSRITTLPKSIQNKFYGEVTRLQIDKIMQDSSCLILISDGEADALVLHEALSHGLEVIVTKESIGSIDAKHPYVHIINGIEEMDEKIEEIGSRSNYDPDYIANTHKAQNLWDIKVRELELIIFGNLN